MDNLKEKALILHSQGYNCAQAVCAVFADRTGLDEDMLFRLSEGFGAGTGNLQGACGALSAAVILAGLYNSGGKDSEKLTKGSTYKLAAKLNNEFTERVGSIYCKDIKGIETGNILKSCNGCIFDAIDIIEENIFNKQ